MEGGQVQEGGEFCAKQFSNPASTSSVAGHYPSPTYEFIIQVFPMRRIRGEACPHIQFKLCEAFSEVGKNFFFEDLGGFLSSGTVKL